MVCRFRRIRTSPNKDSIPPVKAVWRLVASCSLLSEKLYGLKCSLADMAAQRCQVGHESLVRSNSERIIVDGELAQVNKRRIDDRTLGEDNRKVCDGE